MSLQAEVRPRCGRVVGFGAGKENPHGVRAVTKGQRCAVALWFTLNPAHEEKVTLMELIYFNSYEESSHFMYILHLCFHQERIQAQDMLKMFSTPVNAEFSQKNPGGSLEVDQIAADKKQVSATTEPKLDSSTEAEKPKDTAQTNPMSKKSSKVKGTPKSKAKESKSKPAAKKQTVKTQSKQVNKLDTSSASTQPETVSSEKNSASDSESSKDEL